MKAGDYTKARFWLDDSKSYSDYAMETIVHFRIHTALRQMSLINKQLKHSQSVTEGELEVGEEVGEASPGVMGSLWGAFTWRRWSSTPAGESDKQPPEAVEKATEAFE